MCTTDEEQRETLTVSFWTCLTFYTYVRLKLLGSRWTGQSSPVVIMHNSLL